MHFPAIEQLHEYRREQAIHNQVVYSNLVKKIADKAEFTDEEVVALDEFLNRLGITREQLDADCEKEILSRAAKV